MASPLTRVPALRRLLSSSIPALASDQPGPPLSGWSEARGWPSQTVEGRKCAGPTLPPHSIQTPEPGKPHACTRPGVSFADSRRPDPQVRPSFQEPALAPGGMRRPVTSGRVHRSPFIAPATTPQPVHTPLPCLPPFAQSICLLPLKEEDSAQGHKEPPPGSRKERSVCSKGHWFLPRLSLKCMVSTPKPTLKPPQEPGGSGHSL